MPCYARAAAWIAWCRPWSRARWAELERQLAVEAGGDQQVMQCEPTRVPSAQACEQCDQTYIGGSINGTIVTFSARREGLIYPAILRSSPGVSYDRQDR